MKILVSTRHTNGQKKRDRCECPEGEWLMFPKLSDCVGDVPPGFAGVVTNGLTNTARVINLPVTTLEFMDAVGQANERQLGVKLTDEQSLITIGMEGMELLRMASLFEENEILELTRSGMVNVRKVLPVCKTVQPE